MVTIPPSARACVTRDTYVRVLTPSETATGAKNTRRPGPDGNHLPDHDDRWRAHAGVFHFSNQGRERAHDDSVRERDAGIGGRRQG